MPEPGYIYALINASMEGVVKVGRTGRAPAERARELSQSTGVPTPFIVAFEQRVKDAVSTEQYVHVLLAEHGYRISGNREFFNAPLPRIIEAMLTAATADKRVSLREAGGRNPEPPDEGDPAATLFEQAENYYYGLGDYLEDPEEAKRLFMQAAKLGSPEACRILGNIHWHGACGNENPKSAIEWFKKGAERGDHRCWAALGNVYGSQGHSTNAKKCWDRFFSHHLKPDDSDDVFDCCFYSSLYGIDLDLLKASMSPETIEAAIQCADRQLEHEGESDSGGSVRVAAKRHLVQLRSERQSSLQEILGEAEASYERGDYQEAWRRYQVAAGAEMVLAYRRLGEMALNGKGCLADAQQAINWFAGGAELDDPTCWGEIARTLDRGGDLGHAEEYWDSFFSYPLESMEDGALIFSYFHTRRQWGEIPDAKVEVAGREAAFGHALVFAAELLERTRDDWTPEDQNALELVTMDLVALLPPEAQEIVLARFACRSRIEQRLAEAVTESDNRKRSADISPRQDSHQGKPGVDEE